MKDNQKELVQNIKKIIGSVRFNFDRRIGMMKIVCNKDNQIEKYEHRITQLTLPHRFGMYKNLKNAKKVKPIELETPTIQDNTDGPGGNHNPNHKRRSIFPIDPEK